jgi:two-component system sensor histidine kinase KdpD
VPLQREWQSVEDLAGVGLQRVQERLQDHTVDLKIPPELPPVYVDAGFVAQLFANLFDNLAKYTPPGTHAWVSAINEGASVRVVVEDDGPGLPAGDPERLFEKFQRGSGEGAVAGAGLGLTICRAIVRAHGGEISARRRDGGGARFEFTLPARAPRT